MVGSDSITDRRRSQLWDRHGLNGGCGSVGAVVHSVVVLHATDPATVHLGLAARLPNWSAEQVSAELHDPSSFVKLHAMRRTVFVARRDDVPMLRAAAGGPLAERERREVLTLLTSSGLGHTWLESVTRQVIDLLADGSLLSGAELGRLEPRLRQTVRAPGRASTREVSIGGRLLGLLAMEGVVERRAPAGSWQSSQVKWARARSVPELDPAQARRDLVRRYLERFGPTRTEDVVWWTGWGKRLVAAALAGLDVVHVDLADGAGIELADLVDSIDPDPPLPTGVALLPALDPTVMGWKHRDWYLPPDLLPDLVDRTGNLGPTVWVDGGVVGGWGQDAAGSVRLELSRPISPSNHDALSAARQSTETFLAGRVVRPRFRTPLEQRIAAQQTNTHA